MKKESGFLLKNYLLTIKGKEVISRNYKLLIKDIGCNARCPFCDDWKNLGGKEKIVKNLFELIEQIKKEKIPFKNIEILGGEPLLIFKEILAIVDICKKSNITVKFPTNASLLSREKIDLLMVKGMKNFTFSLDFPSDEHDRVRKLPGAYKKIIDFTQYIQSKKGEVQRNTIIAQFNINVIENFKILYTGGFLPNTHNFIALEENNIFSKNELLGAEEKRRALDLIEILQQDFKHIQMQENGFKKDLANNTKTKCFVPLTMRNYYIKENSISISPCHFDSKTGVQDIDTFTLKAITEGCNLCQSSCKSQVNENMLHIFKKLRSNKKVEL